MHICPNYLLVTHFPSRAQGSSRGPSVFPHNRQVQLFQAHCIGPSFFVFLFLFFKALQVTHRPKGVDAWGNFSTFLPSNCLQGAMPGQTEEGETGETLKASREQSRKLLITVTSLLNWGPKSILPPGNARWSNRKNDVLPDTKIRLLTTKQFLGWPSFILCICRA